MTVLYIQFHSNNMYLVVSLYLSLFVQLQGGQGPVLMTTVAMPVFSTKNETVSDRWTVYDGMLYVRMGFCV